MSRVLYPTFNQSGQRRILEHIRTILGSIIKAIEFCSYFELQLTKPKFMVAFNFFWGGLLDNFLVYLMIDAALLSRSAQVHGASITGAPHFLLFYLLITFAVC